MTFKMNLLRNYNLCCVFLILIIVCLGEINCLSCPLPDVANLRYRQRGLRIRLQCSIGYELIGSKSSTCLLGRWRPPVPQCVRSGCPELPSLENGVKIEVRYQALVMFFCNPGFTMEGGAMLSCNGVKWNGTTPVCKSNLTESTPTSCDFEENDCGWENIVGRGTEWQRVSKGTKDEHGPLEDHTNQTDSSHFMELPHYIHYKFYSSFLISPVFPSTLTESGCFVFYYFIRDLANNGGLRVYVYPESDKSSEAFTDTSISKKYLKYEISGQREDIWLRGDFDLEPLNDRFQVIIESYRENFGGLVYHAVDDLAVMKKDECEKLRLEKNQTNLRFSPASCLNRCGHDPYEHFKDYNEEVCFCDEALCTGGKNTCCSDYNNYCVFGSSTIPNDESAATDNSYTESESIQTKFSTSDTSSTPIFTVYNTSFKEITKIPDDGTTTGKTTNASKYPSRPIAYPPAVQKLTTTSPKTTQYVPPTITTARPTTSNIVTTKSTTPKIGTTKSTALKTETTAFTRNNTVKMASRSTIQFLTDMPLPYKNFTGILNKTVPVYAITNTTVIFRNKGIRVIPLGGQPNDVTTSTTVPTTTSTSTTVTTPSLPFTTHTTEVSKLTEFAIKSFQIAKVEKLEKPQMPSYAKWLMTLSGIGLILLIAGVVLIKTGKIRRINNPLKNKRNSHLSSPGSCADMRYLVEDEELEHEC